MIFNFTSFPTLKTERLLLREASFNDIKTVFELRSNKEINKFVGTKRVENIEEATNFIALCDNLYKQQKRIFWLIEYQKKIIGSIVLHNISLDKNYAEIGYKLKTKNQQQGFMSETLEKVINFGFSEMKLKTIEAYTHKNNMASIALLMKNSFIFQPERKCEVYDFNRIYKLEQINAKTITQ